MTSNVDWNTVIGFKPVRRRGPALKIAGTSGLDPHSPIAADPADQTRRALHRILEELESVGGKPEDITGVNIYLQDIRDWQSVGTAFGEVLGHVGVALTMVEARLVDPRMLVEIDASAWVA